MPDEGQAREHIDRLLRAAGWDVVDPAQANIIGTRGVAIREFPLKDGHGFADYMLYVDGRAAGVLEAKKQGFTLSGVEIQSDKYVKGLPDALPAWRKPLPFAYQSTGIETNFTNGLDPEQLLKRILEARRAQGKGKGKYKEPAAPDTDNLFDLPEGWAWASLDQLSWESGYGTSVKCSYDSDGPPVLRIPNVENASLDLSNLKFGPTSLSISAAAAVSAGDMLVIRTNGSKSLIGRAAVVLAAPPVQMSFASYLMRPFVRLISRVMSSWKTSRRRETFTRIGTVPPLKIPQGL